VDRVRTLEVGTATPLLLELFRRQRLRKIDIVPLLSALESFLVRRMVCHLNTRGYNRLFVDLLAILDRPDAELETSLNASLLAGTADSNRWPSDEEFRRAWMEEPIYERQPQARVRLLLEAVEQQLHSQHTESVAFGETLTIEHVMPQQWREHWPLAPNATIEQALERDLAVHRLGNLTLVRDTLNPAMSNGAWDTKRDALDEHTVLMLNRAVVARDTWDEEAIRQRASTLFEFALQIWPRPQPQGAGGAESATPPVATGAVTPGAVKPSSEKKQAVPPGSEPGLEFSRRATSKALIEDLIAEFGLDEALFRRIHHFGPHRYESHYLLKEHLKYCDRAPRFTEEGTNVGTARRLAVCLSRLRQGASWDEAIREAHRRFPVTTLQP
jgi:hypothetical protein